MKSSTLLIGLGALISVSISQGAVNLTSGHMDLGLGEGTELELHVHDESTETEYAPDEAVIVVPQSSYAFVNSNGGRPSGSAWDPLGVSAGEKLLVPAR